jgi:hypothetical protein
VRKKPTNYEDGTSHTTKTSKTLKVFREHLTLAFGRRNYKYHAEIFIATWS